MSLPGAGVAVPVTESGPLPLSSVKDVVKHGSPMCPIVNSTLSCGLQTLVPPCSVPVNKFCFSASDCTLQHGLPKSVGHESGANILGVFTGLKPVAEVSPIQVDKLQLELVYHPNQGKVTYVLNSLMEGFHLGFESSTTSLKSASRNLQSATLHPSVIDKYLQTEVGNGRVAGPFPSPPLSNLHISGFGVIPKRNQEDKWLLILDLSSPTGNSVNDGIPKDKFSVQYMHVDDIINTVMELGKGALIAKFDIQNAYRIVPIHPDDPPGHAMARSVLCGYESPFWSSVSTIHFHVHCRSRGVESKTKPWSGVCRTLHGWLPYIGSPKFNDMSAELGHICVQLCKEWGIPPHPDKLEGIYVHYNIGDRNRHS